MKNVNRFTNFAGSALMLITLAFGANAKTIYVNNGSGPQNVTPGVVPCPGPNDPKTVFGTIQAGVNAAAPGDTVFVCEGTYPEQVTINKALRLQGENLANT